MTRIGRNDPCHCGSGKKYKKCCLASDEDAARAVAREKARGRPDPDADDDDEEDERALELELASNVVVDMIKAGQLEEAEQAAHDLLERFPEVHDGYDRLGMVCEARGDNRQAAEYYRQAMAFIHEHAEDYEPEAADFYRQLIDRLERPVAVD